MNAMQLSLPKDIEIVAVKHNTRNHEKRCAAYWVLVEEDRKKIYYNRINDAWFCRGIPKKLLKILESAEEDQTGYGLKRGTFIISVNKDLEFLDFGHVKFSNVIFLRKKC
jgi:hypothetical protein